MDFEVHKNIDVIVFKLKEKRLDTSISPGLKAEFLLLCKPDVKHLIVDLSAVEFCDSSGLSALLIAQRKVHEHGGTMTLAGCRRQVLSLLKISQLDRVFAIADSVDAVGNHHRKNHPPKHQIRKSP